MTVPCVFERKVCSIVVGWNVLPMFAWPIQSVLDWQYSDILISHLQIENRVSQQIHWLHLLTYWPLWLSRTAHCRVLSNVVITGLAGNCVSVALRVTILENVIFTMWSVICTACVLRSHQSKAGNSGVKSCKLETICDVQASFPVLLKVVCWSLIWLFCFLFLLLVLAFKFALHIYFIFFKFLDITCV